MRNFFLTLFICAPFALAAQTPAPPLFRVDSSKARGQADIRERLVALALQNPNYEQIDHSSRATYYQIRLARNEYLNMFFAAGNFNEYSFKKTTSTSTNGTTITVPNYFPKYNFGVNVPFGIFGRVSNTVKAAKENYAAAIAAKNAKALEIKAEVLTRYENYLLAKQVLDIQSRLTQGEYSAYKRAESDFQENLIKLNDVETAQKNYVSEQVKGLTLQRDFNITKIALEMVIGVRIEDVERGMK